MAGFEVTNSSWDLSFDEAPCYQLYPSNHSNFCSRTAGIVLVPVLQITYVSSEYLLLVRERRRFLHPFFDLWASKIFWQIQLTLGQHGFELQGSTYTQIFFFQ